MFEAILKEIKAFAAAKDTVELPAPEPKAFTNFIR